MAAETVIQGEFALPPVDPEPNRASDGARVRAEAEAAPEGDPAALASAEPAGGLQPALDCKGIRSTSDFPRQLTGLTTEQIAHHYSALRNSHASLSRSRGQLLRRSREFREAQERFLTTLASYEQRLLRIGEEKADAMGLAQEMHRELEEFGRKQQALDQLLDDLDVARQEAGFWSVFQINQLLERMRALLRGERRRDD